MTQSKDDIGWPKRIRVERRIVDLLSRSLYSDFPRAIRELVSNSYDADATVIRIKIDLKAKEVTIEDNGNGMSSEHFDKYLKIAGEPIEGGRLSPKFQRNKIGRFGVGFLASFPFCERLEVTSKREGSEVGFTAIIPAARFIRGIGIEEDVSSIPVNGYNEAKSSDRHEHYTKIRLAGINPLAEEYFRKVSERKRVTIEAWDGLRRLEWQLCENLPLDFQFKNSPLASCLSGNQVGMEIWLNDKKLVRNDIGGQLVASTEQTYKKIGNIEFRYAIVTDWGIIQPVEARGLKIRVNNVGIGPRTYLDVEKEVRTFSRLNWLSGEIHIISGLDESLALNRDSFTWSQDYQFLKEDMHKILTRSALWVEKIAYAEKRLKDLFIGKGSQRVIFAKEITNESIKAFESAGFAVKHENMNDSIYSDSKIPLIIDKVKKSVIVIDDHPSVGETIEIAKYGSKIRYTPFETNSKETEPIRLSEGGVIEVNSAYPLFSGKTKGDMLRRIHLISFMAKQKSDSVDEMYNYLIKHLKEEFK